VVNLILSFLCKRIISLFSFSNAYNQSFEAIFTAMLPVVSSLMNKATIAATEQYVEPCSLYTIICGFQSSKKSVCIDLYKSDYREAIDAIDALSENLLDNSNKNRLDNSIFKPYSFFLRIFSFKFLQN